MAASTANEWLSLYSSLAPIDAVIPNCRARREVTSARRARDFELCVVEPDEVGGVGVVGVADQAPVGELELVYVREIPARERRVDRVRELLEGVGWPDDEHAAWCGVAVDPTPAEEIDLDPQPLRAIERPA